MKAVTVTFVIASLLLTDSSKFISKKVHIPCQISNWRSLDRIVYSCGKICLQFLKVMFLRNDSICWKIGFVLFWLPISYQRAFKRASFALQKGTFYTSKDALLHCKRASFTMQKSMYCFAWCYLFLQFMVSFSWMSRRLQ